MFHSYTNRRVHLLAAATALALAVAAPAYSGEAHLSGLKSGESYSRFMIKYKSGSAPAMRADAVNSSLAAASAHTVLPAGSRSKALGLTRQRRTSIGADVVTTANALNSLEAEALMQQLAADPNVEWVQPDNLLRAFAVPNDTRYGEQWHYANSAVGINAPAAWDVTNGSGVVVAVIDSGIVSHSDLNANILPGYDMIASSSSAGDGNGRDSDPKDVVSSSQYHGTHVAGTVAAVTNNGAGVAGVAYGAKVVPIRVLGNSGSESDLVDAITWASGGAVPGVPNNPNPAKVINMSLGANARCPAAIQAAVDAAVQRGSVVIAAAGNSNIDVAGAYPAGCNNVIAVAASDHIGNRAFYSSYGAKIALTAPGGEVRKPANGTEFLRLGEVPTGSNTVPASTQNGVLSTVNNNAYAKEIWAGTSMASPHVAGVAALILSASQTPKTPAQVRQILTGTARPIAAAKCPGGCGAGLVDASAAVNAAK